MAKLSGEISKPASPYGAEPGHKCVLSGLPRNRLDELYRLHTPWLLASIRRRFGGDAEDVIQETWLRLAPLGELSGIRHPQAFLLKVASNLAINRAKQSRRRREILDTARPLQASGQGEDQLDALQLQQIIIGLPQPLRDVFLLSRLGGLTNFSVRPGTASPS